MLPQFLQGGYLYLILAEKSSSGKGVWYSHVYINWPRAVVNMVSNIAVGHGTL